MLSEIATLNPIALKPAILPVSVRISPETQVVDAIAQLAALSNASSCALVLDNGAVVGIFTASDVVRLTAQFPDAQFPDAQSSEFAGLTMRQVMTQPAIALAERDFTDPWQALDLLEKHRIGHLPILDEQKGLLGVVTPESLLRSLRSSLPSPEVISELTPELIIEPTPKLTNELTTELPPQPEPETPPELAILEQILESVLAGYWDWHVPSHYEYLSPRFKQMFGYEDHELPNTPDSWQAIIFPEDLPRVFECFERHVQSQGKTPFQGEFRYCHKDGSTVWVNCSGQVIEWDSDRAPVRVIGCHIDISERKQAEAELKANSLYYQDIIAGQTELICRFWPDSTLTFVNDAYCDFFQKSAAELLGKRFFSFLPEKDREIPLQHFNTLSVANPVVTYEHRVKAPDGSLRWQQWTDRALFSPEGRIVEFQAVGRDITALKLAQENLHQVSTRLNLAVESAGMGIWDWDITHNHLVWGARMYELYGLDASKPCNVYTAWLNALHPGDRAAAEVVSQQALAGERDYDTEFRVIHSDGSIRFVKAKALVQWDLQGNAQRMIGINYDITERKQAEEQIRRYTAQLEASNRELEAFAYSVSHDLRGPLRAIDGFSKALLEDYGETFDAEGKDYFDRICGNVAKMDRLIDDLLNLSRVSRTAIRYSTVDLSALAKEVMSDLQSSAPERSVAVAIAPDMIVSADTTLMRVILTNLLGNAWKFTAHHPTARIEFGRTKPDQTEPGQTEPDQTEPDQIEPGQTEPGQTERQTNNNETIYFVKDDGAGFDMAFSKMLFGAFQRLHNHQEFPGTGIGLAATQRAVHRHGGSLWAQAAVEQGATLYFTIPGTDLTLGA